MKALKGDQIVCSTCGALAGSFRVDVADGASITGNDISIDAELDTKPDSNAYLCWKCHAVVARQVRSRHWEVHIPPNRWLE